MSTYITVCVSMALMIMFLKQKLFFQLVFVPRDCPLFSKQPWFCSSVSGYSCQTTKMVCNRQIHLMGKTVEWTLTDHKAGLDHNRNVLKNPSMSHLQKLFLKSCHGTFASLLLCNATHLSVSRCEQIVTWRISLDISVTHWGKVHKKVTGISAASSWCSPC